MTTELWAVLLVLFVTLPSAFGPILIKKGSSRGVRKFYKNPNLLAGLGIYGVSAIFFTIALRGGELSVLYPLVSVGYVWVSLLSVKYLNEKMNSSKWLGVLLIVAGVSLIGLGS